LPFASASDIVEVQIAGHLENYKTSGAELIMGAGRFVAPRTLEVRPEDGGTRVLTGDQVFKRRNPRGGSERARTPGSGTPHIEALSSTTSRHI
jgi:pyruvate/2-oxoglutarate dehydrogenase complex dihydrolipoamide dehydrogenase (E3) component